ncbi:MAG TPA: hypothetical protein VD838_03195, partial [Anaeromyxobacteraceae bacterium]|nr:hypothetical protein [Anaeromyxobacteraceae bacterium]
MEVPREVADELKAIREDVSRKFDDQIKTLTREAQAKWDEFQKNPDALIGNAVKSILADKERLIDQKADELTKRMDEMEAKAKERRAGGAYGPADLDAEIKAKLD